MCNISFLRTYISHLCCSWRLPFTIIHITRKKYCFVQYFTTSSFINCKMSLFCVVVACLGNLIQENRDSFNKHNILHAYILRKLTKHEWFNSWARYYYFGHICVIKVICVYSRLIYFKLSRLCNKKISNVNMSSSIFPYIFFL